LTSERGERRFRIHRRDQPIKAEHLSLSLKETGLKDSIKRAVPPQQLRCAFWPDPNSARQFARRVTPQRNEVVHLVRDPQRRLRRRESRPPRPLRLSVHKPQGGDKFRQDIYCRLGFWCSAIGR
jgi:hypothetical protein